MHGSGQLTVLGWHMAVSGSRRARAARQRQRRMAQVVHDLTDDQWTDERAFLLGHAEIGADLAVLAGRPDAAQ